MFTNLKTIYLVVKVNSNIYYYKTILRMFFINFDYVHLD